MDANDTNIRRLIMPIRYDHSLMERQNKRERDIIESRFNDDVLCINRPRLEKLFIDEEEEKKKKEVEQILNLIPNSKITEKSKSTNNNNDKCMICLSNFKKGDKESTLPCLHMFHSNCIKRWIFQKSSCPICKYDIYLYSLLFNQEQ